MWDLGTLFGASLPDEAEEDDLGQLYFRMDPMNEVEVEAGARLTAIVKGKTLPGGGGGGAAAAGGEQNIWYIQVRLQLLHFSPPRMRTKSLLKGCMEAGRGRFKYTSIHFQGSIFVSAFLRRTVGTATQSCCSPLATFTKERKKPFPSVAPLLSGGNAFTYRTSSFFFGAGSRVPSPSLCYPPES